MQILTPAEAAALLRVNVVTLRRWRQAGDGPPVVRFGPRMLRYRRADIESWLSREAVGR